MSEPVPVYDVGQRKPWRCEHCGAELATVDDKGEAVAKGLDVSLGHCSVQVSCPKCGAWNVWCLDGDA